MGQPEASNSLNLLGPGKPLPCLDCPSGNSLFFFFLIGGQHSWDPEEKAEQSMRQP